MLRALTAIIGLFVAAFIVLVLGGAFGPVGEGPLESPSRATAEPTAVGPPPSSRVVTLTLTEQELTEAARSYMPMTVSGITVTDPSLRLEPGRVTLTATGRAFVIRGAVVVVATPVITDGMASARVESATFAGVALADSTKQDIAETFTAVLRANIPPGMRVTAISVRTGILIVEALLPRAAGVP